MPARGWRVHYQNEKDEFGNEYATAISYHREDVQASPTLSKKTTQRERVIGLLKSQSLQTNIQIAEYLGKTNDQARSFMHRELKKKSPVWKQFPDGWGLLDRNHSERVTRNSYVRERYPVETPKGLSPQVLRLPTIQ